ncbi:RSP_7527 family protein [Marinobacter sp.]|uniref:RSP_7527 family protein n=1 Tax=Marinobacter sp. TaxID=50741 RepID=UPI003A8FFE80
MATELSTIPSIDEINDLVKRAKRERNQYIAESVGSLVAKLNAASRSFFETVASKLAPSH